MIKQTDFSPLFEVVFNELVKIETEYGVKVESFTFREDKFTIEISDMAMKYQRFDEKVKP